MVRNESPRSADAGIPLKAVVAGAIGAFGTSLAGFRPLAYRIFRRRDVQIKFVVRKEIGDW